MKRACVTGADRGLGLSLVRRLLADGWNVVAGQFMPEWPELDSLKREYAEHLVILPLDVSNDDSVRAFARYTPGTVDMLISNAGIPDRVLPATQDKDYASMLNCINVNALGGVRITLELIDKLRLGIGKRLCYISSEAGSIGEATRDGEVGYCMSKAALNMAVKVFYNALTPEGFHFKLYHPGWMRSYMMGEIDPQADLDTDEAASFALEYFLGDGGDDTLKLVGFDGREYSW